MNGFQHPEWGILLVPNKCSSSYAQHLIPKEYHRKFKSDIDYNSETKVWAIVRDPVEWYVSGWRYVRSGFIYENKDLTYNKNFEQHLEYCLEVRKIHNSTKRVYNQFDRHTWYNPYEQSYDFFNHIDKIIKLENQKRYNQVIAFFSDNATPTNAKNEYNLRTAQISNLRYYPKPTLTKNAISLLKELDNWSYKAGYDLDESIKNYINTLCY